MASIGSLSSGADPCCPVLGMVAVAHATSAAKGFPATVGIADVADVAGAGYLQCCAGPSWDAEQLTPQFRWTDKIQKIFATPTPLDCSAAAWCDTGQYPGAKKPRLAGLFYAHGI